MRGRTRARRGHAAVAPVVVAGRGGFAGLDVRPVPRPGLPRHQTRPHRQSAAFPGPRDQSVEQRAAIRPVAEPGLRLPVSARHLLPDRPPTRGAWVDHPAAVVGGPADGRLLGIAAGRRSAGHRQPDVPGARGGRVRAVAAGADHTRLDLVGDAADDAGAVGAAADDPGPGEASDRSVRVTGRPSRVGGGVDGRGQRDRDAGRLSARGDLVGLSSPGSTLVALHGWLLLAVALAVLWWVVALGLIARRQSAVPGLHRILRRDDAMVLTGGDAARHRQLDPVRGAYRHGGSAAGDRVGGNAGDLPGRGGRTRRAWPAGHAGAGAAGDDAVGRCGVAGRWVQRRAGLAGGPTGAGIPGRPRRPAAQRTQARPVVRIPLVLGFAQLLGRIPLPGSAPKSAWLRALAHPERDKRVAVAIVALTALMVHLAGLDRSAHPAGHVHRDTAVLA